MQARLRGLSPPCQGVAEDHVSFSIRTSQNDECFSSTLPSVRILFARLCIVCICMSLDGAVLRRRRGKPCKDSQVSFGARASECVVALVPKRWSCLSLPGSWVGGGCGCAF